MITLNPDVRDLYRQDSVTKSYFVVFRDLGIVKTNSDIIAESLSITESIGSSDQFEIGLCEAGAAKLSMYLDVNVAGDEMTIVEVLGDFEPEISVDDEKGIVFSDSSMSVLYEGDLDDIGSTSVKFDGTKNYILLGKLLYTNKDWCIYLETPRGERRTIYYIPNNTFELVESQYINICIPIIGSDFAEYKIKFYSDFDEYEHEDVQGYATLYEIAHPIMPLGVYMIDYAKKSHEDSSIRDLQGYDKMNLGKLDEIHEMQVSQDLQVDLYLENVVDGTPLELGDNLNEADISGSFVPLTIVSRTDTDVTISDAYTVRLVNDEVCPTEYTIPVSGKVEYYSSFDDDSYRRRFAEISGDVVNYDTRKGTTWDSRVTEYDIWQGGHSTTNFFRPADPLELGMKLSPETHFYGCSMDEKEIDEWEYLPFPILNNSVQETLTYIRNALFSYESDPDMNGFRIVKYEVRGDLLYIVIRSEACMQYDPVIPGDTSDGIIVFNWGAYEGAFPEHTKFWDFLNKGHYAYIPYESGESFVAAYKYKLDFAFQGFVCNVAFAKNSSCPGNKLDAKGEWKQLIKENLYIEGRRLFYIVYNIPTDLPVPRAPGPLTHDYHNRNKYWSIKLDSISSYGASTIYFDDINHVFNREVYFPYPTKYHPYDDRQLANMFRYDNDWGIINRISWAGVTLHIPKKNMTCDWTEIITKTKLVYHIQGYNSRYTYMSKFYAYNAFGAGKNERIVQDLALSQNGSMITNKHTEIMSLIADNTSDSLDIDTETGNFEIDYISKIRYYNTFYTYYRYSEDKDKIYDVSSEYGDVVADSYIASETTSLAELTGTRLVGELVRLTLAPNNLPMTLSSARRHIIASYLELTGNFINFNRHGVTNMLAPIATFSASPYVYDVESDSSIFLELNRKDTYPDIVDEIATDGYIVNKANTMEVIERTDDVESPEASQYSQPHSYNILDLILTSETTESITSDSPVYVVNGIGFNETVVCKTAVYEFPVDSISDNCRFYVESNLSDIIDYESNIKAIAEALGELTVDNQTQFLNRIYNELAVNEGVEISKQYNDNQEFIGYTIEMSYISEISYINSNNESGNYMSTPILNKVIGPVKFNNQVMFATEEVRCYCNTTISEITYKSTKSSNALDSMRINYEDIVSDYIDSLYETMQNYGTLIVDNIDFIRDIISVTNSVSREDINGETFITVNYISNIYTTMYTGVNDTVENRIYEDSKEFNSALVYFAYQATVQSNAVFVKDRVHYYFTITEREVDYEIPEYRLGYDFEYECKSSAEYWTQITSKLNEIKTAIIADSGGSFDVDRYDEYVSALSDYILDELDGDYYKSQYDVGNKYLYFHYFPKIECRKVYIDDNTEFAIKRTHPLINFSVTPSNTEPINDFLIQQLYIEDHINAPYTGVCIRKSNVVDGDLTYPYYYNQGGTTGFNREIHYYEIQDNFFIDNFKFTSAQIQAVCEDMMTTLNNLDSYNVDATYKALPYIEVCDKVCLEGTNHIIGEQNDLYYTVVLSRTLKGNIGMVDKLETEFDND